MLITVKPPPEQFKHRTFSPDISRKDDASDMFTLPARVLLYAGSGGQLGETGDSGGGRTDGHVLALCCISSLNICWSCVTMQQTTEVLNVPRLS